MYLEIMVHYVSCIILAIMTSQDIFHIHGDDNTRYTRDLDVVLHDKADISRNGLGATELCRHHNVYKENKLTSCVMFAESSYI
jgi:hypothetical protein